MKKGKVILSAIALFAIIGGALAFKANTQKFLPPDVFTSYTTTTTPGGQIVTRCKLSNFVFSTTGTIGVYYTSTGPQDVCLGTTTTTITLANDI